MSLYGKQEKQVTINVFNENNNFFVQSPPAPAENSGFCPTCHQPWPKSHDKDAFFKPVPQPPAIPTLDSLAPPTESIFKITRHQKPTDKRLMTTNQDGLRPSEYKQRIELGLGNLNK